MSDGTKKTKKVLPPVRNEDYWFLTPELHSVSELTGVTRRKLTHVHSHNEVYTLYIQGGAGGGTLAFHWPSLVAWNPEAFTEKVKDHLIAVFRRSPGTGGLPRLGKSHQAPVIETPSEVTPRPESLKVPHDEVMRQEEEGKWAEEKVAEEASKAHFLEGESPVPVELREISEEEALKVVQRFRHTFPKVAEWIDAVKAARARIPDLKAAPPKDDSEWLVLRHQGGGASPPKGYYTSDDIQAAGAEVDRLIRRVTAEGGNIGTLTPLDLLLLSVRGGTG